MAEQAHETQDKTEPATPKRLEDARSRGQVPRSRELATTALLLSAASAFLLLGPEFVNTLARISARVFTHAQVHRAREIELWPPLRDALTDTVIALAPFLAVMVFAALMAPLALGGWAFSTPQLGFKWDKLDPVKGLGRVFSWNGLMEMIKALGKFLVVAGTAALILVLAREQFLALGTTEVGPALGYATLLLVFGFLALSGATLLIALVDVPFQLWNHARQQRMTRQEVKDELKQTEGKPEVKSRVRMLQREIASRRMMEAVPSADVVVTNPAHYAVALRYDAAQRGAPVLVAKGIGHLAKTIRDTALEHGVPLLRSPAVARAIYHSTKLDGEIPSGLYTAVAQVLAYVYRLKQAHPTGELPPLPEEPPIPDWLRVAP